MIQFGGSFLPVHFVGALVEGSVPANGWNLNYNVGVGNGRGQVISRDGDFGDINNSRATLVNVFVRPDFLYGAQIGGSFYHDQLTPTTAPAAEEWIQSGHLVWAKETPEFIAEFANVTHKPNNGGVTSNSQAFYVQTAYRLPKSLKPLKPYVHRFEYLRVPQSDAIFRGLKICLASPPPRPEFVTTSPASPLSKWSIAITTGARYPRFMECFCKPASHSEVPTP